MTDKSAMANPALKIPADLRAQMMEAMNSGARELFRRFLPKVLNTARMIEREIDKVSKQAGLDPKYVHWLLGRPHLWPSIVAGDRSRLLFAARVLAKAGVTVPYAVMSPTGVGMSPADNDLAADAALSNLGDWTSQKLIPLLKREYGSVGWPLAKEHADALALPNNRWPPAQQAGAKISRYMEYLLTEKRIGSPNGNLVLSALHLIL
jgi:hypothetical protein